MKRQEKEELRSYTVEALAKEHIPDCMKIIARERRNLGAARYAGQTDYSPALMLKTKKKLAFLNTILSEKLWSEHIELCAKELGL